MAKMTRAEKAARQKELDDAEISDADPSGPAPTTPLPDDKDAPKPASDLDDREKRRQMATQTMSEATGATILKELAEVKEKLEGGLEIRDEGGKVKRFGMFKKKGA
jgi:hypothetical protein